MLKEGKGFSKGSFIGLEPRLPPGSLMPPPAPDSTSKDQSEDDGSRRKNVSHTTAGVESGGKLDASGKCEDRGIFGSQMSREDRNVRNYKFEFRWRDHYVLGVELIGVSYYVLIMRLQ